MKIDILLHKPKTKNKKRLLVAFAPILFLVAFLNSQSALAQNKVITGKVFDTENLPLPGATIKLENQDTKAVTGFDGSYSITIPDTGSQSLTFSFMGFLPKTVAVTKSVVNVTLATNTTTLSQVVFVGYGTQKKESLTAAVSVISNKEIQTTTNVSVAQKLSGKIAGVQIRQQSGQPGSFDNDINIRGFGQPIYVIDGIRRGGSADFQQLNSDDIESISILKDAAAAIYGLGAANGVILVTTKKGKQAKVSFNYNSVYSAVMPTDIPRMASAAEYTQMWNDTQLFAPGGSGKPYYSAEEIELWKQGGPGYESTDWGDLVIKNQATTVQHNFSATGSTNKTNYFMSFGAVNEDGLIKSNDIGYQRYTFRSNLTTEFTKNLKGSLLLSGRWDKSWQPGADFFNIFKATRTSLPTLRPYANDTPGYISPVNGFVNPLAAMDRDLTGYSDNNTRIFTSTFSLEYEAPFIKGLSFKVVAAYDSYNFQNKNLAKPYNLYTYDAVKGIYNTVKENDGNGRISNTNNNSNSLAFQGFITYNNTFGNNHEIGATAVVEKNSTENRYSFINRNYASFYTKDQLRFADVLGQTSDGIEGESADFSYVGRFNYGFKKKYLLEVAGRYMGTYRYAASSRYGFYPTASVGWRISEEGFMKKYVPWISNLKFRGSYGIAGMPEGDAFQYVAGYSIGSGGSYEFVDGTLTPGIRTPPQANNKLTWMEATTKNVGVDLGLFKNKLNITAEAYQRLLNGIPARRSIALPNTYGGELPQENLNSIITQGLELSIAYKDRIGQDFRYDIAGNVAYARTKRKYVEGEAFTNSFNKWRNQQSDRWNDIAWGYDYIGQFQSEEELRNAPMQNGDQSNATRELPGDFKYSDVNNDGVVDGQDEQPLFYGGSPKVNFGLTLNLEYKGFYINALFQGAANYTVRFREVYAEMFAFRGNTPAYFYDRWHKADPYDVNSEWIPGKWPASRTLGAVGGLYKESSVWRRDASYVRLKTVELGYNLKLKQIEEKLGITNIRFYASGFNLYTWADEFVKPFDPEKIEGAYSAGFTYPVTKTYNFGINVNF
jgi:TonB-linked SusC/RagA family outer membrane protein